MDISANPSSTGLVGGKRVEDIAEFVPSFQSMSLDSSQGAKGNTYSNFSYATYGQQQQYVGSDGSYAAGASPSLSAEDFPPIRVNSSASQPKKPGAPYSGDGNKYYNQQTSPQKAYPQSVGGHLKMTGASRMQSNNYYMPDAEVPYYYQGGQAQRGQYSQTAPLYSNPSQQMQHHQAQAIATQHAAASQILAQQTGRRPIHSFFMSDTLRSDMQKKTLLLLRGSNPDDPLTQNLPKVVHRYHSLYPLEDLSKDRTSRVFGFPSVCYKAVNITDGKAYVLRKIDNARVNPDQAVQAIDTWKVIQHPGIIPPKEIFASQAFNNTNSLFIAHEYHPGAETLEQKFPTGEKAKPGGFISEESLWSFIIQLVSAIRTVHASGLAVRTLVASKVLLTGKNRIRISGVGLDDVLNPASRQVSLQVKQAEDVVLLGKLILRLACASADHSNPSSLPRALESISTSYSAELHSFTLRLMGLVGANRMKLPVGSPPAYPALDELLQLLAPKMVTQIDRLYGYCDTLETELIKEVENGRLFRLVVKLGFINERPDYDVANQWSETEDRYLLKLFRDFVFHQVDEDAAPVLDFSHVVEALNKLDIGVEEKILLTSRDEKYMLVLSYKELRRCLNEAFNELVQRQQAAETTQQQQPSTQVSQPAAQHNFYMTR